MMARLRTIAQHPAMDITVAIILIVTSLAEGWESIVEDIAKFDVGVHHGVLIFGFSQFLRAFSEMVEATKRVTKLSG